MIEHYFIWISVVCTTHYIWAQKHNKVLLSNYEHMWIVLYRHTYIDILFNECCAQGKICLNYIVHIFIV